jgi:hypothetical protein
MRSMPALLFGISARDLLTYWNARSFVPLDELV